MHITFILFLHVCIIYIRMFSLYMIIIIWDRTLLLYLETMGYCNRVQFFILVINEV